MKQRGKKSAASLVLAETLEISPRQLPPAELDETEAATWMALVNSKPAEWFQADTRQLLLAYCRHTATAAVLDQQIAGFEPAWMVDTDGIDRYRKLTDMREKQTRALTSLSRSMRLTQQSQSHPVTAARTAAKSAKSKKPWEG